MSHPMGQEERTVLFKCPTLWDKEKGPSFFNVPPYGTKRKSRPISSYANQQGYKVYRFFVNYNEMIWLFAGFVVYLLLISEPTITT